MCRECDHERPRLQKGALESMFDWYVPQVNAKRPRLGDNLVVLHALFQGMQRADWSGQIRLGLQVVFEELVRELEVCLPAVHPGRYVSIYSIRGFRDTM